MEKHEDTQLMREMYATIKVVDERSQSILRSLENYTKRFETIEEDVKALQQNQSGLMAKVGMGATIMASVVAAIIHKFI